MMNIKNVKIMKIDEPNTNNVLYPRAEVEKLVSSAEGETFCSIEPAFHGTILMSAVSHKMFNVRIEGDYVVCDIETLDTPKGELLESMLKDGSSAPKVSICASSYGTFDIVGEDGVKRIKDLKGLSTFVTTGDKAFD